MIYKKLFTNVPNQIHVKYTENLRKNFFRLVVINVVGHVGFFFINVSYIV